tara:strand:+ start:8651 stop:13318 length:4668 start_codon:yes stop_codon:yes gene_type:complete
MAEKLPSYEEWKIDNPGKSKTFYDQLKHLEEGGSPWTGPASLFSNVAKLFKKDKKVEEETPKYSQELPEIKLTTKDADKIIKKVISEETPDLKDLVKTADIKLEAQENPKTIGFTNALIFATGGPLSVRDDNLPLSYAGFSEKTKTQIADELMLVNANIIKINDTTYVDTTTGQNIYQDIGKNRLTSQAMNGLLEAGYSFGQMLTIPLDLALDEKLELTQKLDNLYNKMYEGGGFRDPNTMGEQVTKTLVEYGIPFGLASKLLRPLNLVLKSKLSKLNNKAVRYSTKAALSVGFNAASFGAAEFVVGNPGDTINAPDFWGLVDNPEIQFEGEEGKKGRNLALARLKNKIRFGYEGTKIGATWGLVGRAAPLGLKYGLKTTGKVFNYGGKVANATVLSPLGKIATGQVPLSGMRVPFTKYTTPTLMYSKSIVPGTSRGIATILRKGGKLAMFKSVEPFLRGVTVSKKGIGFKNKGEIPPFDEWKLFTTTNADPLKRRLAYIARPVNYLTKEFRTPNAIYKLQEQAGLNIKSENRVVNKYLQDLEARAYQLVKAQNGLFNKKAVSPLEVENQMQLVVAYLKNQISKNKLPKELQESAEGLKKHLKPAKSKYLSMLPEGDFQNALIPIINSYMRKSMAITTNPLHNPPKEVIEEAVKAMLKLISSRKNKGMQEEAIEMFKTKGVTRKQALNLFAEATVRNMIVDAKAYAGDPIKYLNEISKNILKSDKIIVTGGELPKSIRKLLGEEKNAQSEILQTITEMITGIETKKMYDEILEIGLKKGWFKKNKGTLDTTLQPIGNLPGLGMLRTNLSDMFASPTMIQALRGSQGIIDMLLKSNAYRALMQFKTGVQFGKTGLSFDTQMRNVVSTPMFVIGYGWIGGKGSVDDAFKFIYNDITGAGKKITNQAFVERVGKGIKLGYLDESIEAQEMLAVIKKLNENPNMVDRWMSGGLKTKFMDRATQFYQAGDNVWKEYAYVWNRNNLNNIFKGNKKELIKQEELVTGQKYNPISKITNKTKTYDDAVDEFAAWYARNLMPTYSLVPEAVRVIRMTPIGSFISWPSEILRLTGVAARTALREASSTNVAIQQNGLRKLMGMTLTLGAAGAVMDRVFEQYTGVDKAMIRAFRRSFAYEYDQNSRFTAVQPMKDNTLTLVNSSYADVWDYIKKPMRAFLNQIGQKDTKVIDNNVMKGIYEAAKEFAEPFFTQNLAIEPIIDALPADVMGRDGKTTEGYSVYSPTDAWGTKVYKGIEHIIRTALPGTILQAKKYGDIAYDIYKGRGDPDAAWQKLVSTITGRKIQKFDLLKIMNQKAGNFASTIKGDLTLSESFYRSSDWETRGPNQIEKEFNQIQEESFIQQQKILQFVTDARTLGIPDWQIAKALKRLKNDQLVSNIMYGAKFTPYTYYSSAFEKRYETAKREAELNGRPLPDYNYVYPIGKLESVMANHIGLDLNKSYEENMKIKEEQIKGLLQNNNQNEIVPENNIIIPEKNEKELFDQKVLELLNNSEEASLNTPPLEQQPDATAITDTASAPINERTGLTTTETALLSPLEQSIRLKQRA